MFYQQNAKGHLTMNFVHPAPTEWEESPIFRRPLSAEHYNSASMVSQPSPTRVNLVLPPEVIKLVNSNKATINNQSLMLNPIRDMSRLSRPDDPNELLGFNYNHVNRWS